MLHLLTYKFLDPPFSLYTGCGGRLGATAKKRPEDIILPRWLVCGSSRQQVIKDTEDVLAHIQAGSAFSWKSPRLQCSEGTPHAKEGGQDPGPPPILSSRQISLLAKASRVDFRCCHACDIGPTQSLPSPAMAEFIQASNKERQAQKT